MAASPIDYVSEIVELLDQWQHIRDLCHSSTGLSLGFVTPGGRLQAWESSLPALCQTVQTSKLGYHRCEECYTEHCLSLAAAEQDIILFKCHAGLTVFAIPIIVDGQIVAAVVSSGVRTDEPQALRLRELAQALGLDTQELIESAAGLQETTEREMRAAARMVRGLLEPLLRTFARHHRQLARAAELTELLGARSDFFIADPLTGVYNAQYVFKRLREELTRAERHQQTLSTLIIKVNSLPHINEVHGYSAGDAVLKCIADLLQQKLRRTEVVGRLRGDKFAAVLPETNQAQAYALARRIQDLVAQIEPAQESNGLPEDVKVSVNIGIASSNGDGCTEDQLIERALLALAQAERTERNIAIYSPVKRGSLKPPVKRVVVTGIGVVSPIGIGKQAFLEGLRLGKSGIRPLTRFDAAFCTSRIAGEVQGFDPLAFVSAKTAKRSGLSTQMGIAAAKMAVEDAGIDLTALDAGRIGTFIGSAISGLEFAEDEAASAYLNGFSRRVNPFLSMVVFAGAVSSEISMELKTRGPSINVSTGCSAASDAIGYAFQNIRDGNADVCIAGGTEGPLTPMVVGSFASLRALSTHNDEPETASRPFDKTRDGFVIAEGAGVVVLEELQHALARGAHIYGEILGYAATGDAYHMTRPAPDGAAAAQAIRSALEEADVSPSDVQYINAHGSATILNDKTETAVIKTVFGDHAYNLAISSTKSQVGHPIGASGGIELIATLLGMEHGFLPPTINYHVPDPECDLDYVPNESRPAKVDLAVSNSFGFGGKNAILVIGRY